MMFQNAARPKARFILWLQMHGKLLTADRLVKWGMAVELKCALCQNFNESRKRMFVECEFAKGLWNRLLQWIQSQPPGAGG